MVVDLGELVWIHGITNSIKHQQILNINLAASARMPKLGRLWLYFQAGNLLKECKIVWLLPSEGFAMLAIPVS